MGLSNLVSNTLDKVKNNALSKAKNKVVSSLDNLTGGVLSDVMGTANKASGIVPDDGASEASKRFEMYNLHTNRPKPSQQFYVLFEPRPIQDLYFKNYIPGKEAGYKKYLRQAEDWAKNQVNSAVNYIKNIPGALNSYIRGKTSSWDPESGYFTNMWGEEYYYDKNGEIKYRKDEYGEFNDDQPSFWQRAKDGVSSAVNTVKGWANDAKEFLFGVSDQVFLYQPTPYNPIKSGWLSSFANRLDARAEIIEWGIFNNGNDDYNALVQACDEVSMHCLDCDRPSWEMPVKRYNQYNRDRLVYEKVKYEPVTMTFYDTIDSALLRLLLYQLAYIDDSYLKTFSHFTEYTQLENFVNNPGNWGMNIFSNTGIFQAISLVEIFGDQCTVYNLMMPKITSVKLTRADASKSDVHKITIKVEYEGLTNYNPVTLSKNDYDIMIGWAMADSNKAASIAKKVRLKYEGPTAQIANTSLSFLLGKGSVKDKLTNMGQRMGFGSEIKLANELTSAIKNKNYGSLVKQIANPSSITSKISRIF